MAVEDGLSQLSARQERRRRQPLPPRFPKSEPDQPGGDEPPAQQEGGETAAPLRSVGAEEVPATSAAVSYTHLRAHETDSYLVCRLLLEKKKTIKQTKLH